MLVTQNPKSEVTAGVNKILCKHWDLFYVGETGSFLNNHIMEHLYAYKVGSNVLVTFLHSYENIHRIDWNTYQML